VPSPTKYFFRLNICCGVQQSFFLAERSSPNNAYKRSSSDGLHDMHLTLVYPEPNMHLLDYNGNGQHRIWWIFKINGPQRY
jgi:hypothetical protein